MEKRRSNRNSTLWLLVGTRPRFVVTLLCQIFGGFVFTILDLHLSARQTWDLAFWLLFTPVLFLVALRRAAVEFQKGLNTET